MLEELSLSRCNAYFAANGVAFSPLELRSHIPIFCGAALSKLRVVSLAGVHIDWTSTALRGLSELEIKYHASDVMPSFEQFKDMLVGCPDLLKLTLLGWGPRPPLPSKRTCAPEMSSRVNITEPPIILPKVTHFSIGFVDIEYTIQLLSTLSLPSLEYLSMEDVSRTINPMEIQDATFLMEWLSRDPAMDISMIPPLPLSLAKIATLHLNGISSTTSSMSSLFVQCSSLRSLHLIQTDTTPLSALHPLVPRDMASGVAVTPCPDLAELVLDSPDFDALTNLATNRNDAGCPSLKRVFVEMSDEDDDDCCINDITRAVFDAAGIKLLAFSS
ncbi:hypothetical protein ONZ45_g11115 [Pleurotus djamor]|nr:hypothetical protein ONZ45_g11115 [Pleurotus djamor]